MSEIPNASIESECPCPNDACARRARCADCFENHADHAKPEFCLREEAGASADLRHRVQERKRRWQAGRA